MKFRICPPLGKVVEPVLLEILMGRNDAAARGCGPWVRIKRRIRAGVGDATPLHVIGRNIQCRGEELALRLVQGQKADAPGFVWKPLRNPLMAGRDGALEIEAAAQRAVTQTLLMCLQRIQGRAQKQLELVPSLRRFHSWNDLQIGTPLAGGVGPHGQCSRTSLANRGPPQIILATFPTLS